MQKTTMAKVIALLSTSFSNLKFEPNVYYELLKDLDDKALLEAVVEFCKTQTELYPGTNVIANLRQRTLEKLRKPQLLKLPEGQRWQSPSKEFRALVKKLSEEK